MTFATQLTLTRADVAQFRLTDEYSIHRVIYSLFDDVRDESKKAESQSSGFVYAPLTQNVLTHQYLIISNRKPRIPANFQGQMVVKEIPDRFFDATMYRFKVIINPTKRNAQTQKLEGIRDKRAILGWFAQRGEQWGIAFETELMLERLTVDVFKGKDNNKITVAKAEISGVLRVTDRERFKLAVTQGVGRSRAFGCGLFQVLPIFD